MSKKCPKCGSEIKAGFSVCTNCGTKIPNEKKKKDVPIRENNKYKGFVCTFLTLLGIFVMFNVSSPLGYIIYIIAFIGSYIDLKDEYDENKYSGIFDFGITYMKEHKLFSEGGIKVVIVAILPLISIIGIHRWIYADTLRYVDSIF